MQLAGGEMPFPRLAVLNGPHRNMVPSIDSYFCLLFGCTTAKIRI
jgi:hypothetical protein